MVKCYFCKTKDAVGYIQAHAACSDCFIMRKQGRRGLMMRKKLCEEKPQYRKEILLINRNS